MVLILGGFNDVNVIFTSRQKQTHRQREAQVPPVSLDLGEERLRLGRSIGGRSCLLLARIEGDVR